jgi:hypothetical protein
MNLTGGDMKRKSLLIIAIASMFILASCASATRSADYALTEGGYDSMKGATGEMMYEAPSAPAEYQSLESDTSATGGIANATADTVEQMIIKNASLNILVDDPMKTLADVMELASDMGGFTVTSNSYQTYTASGDQMPEASITVRVPADKLNDALEEIKGMTGDAKQYVTYESVSGEDVTQEYTDLESRLRNLKEAETELSKMYEKAVEAEDVLAIYNQKMQVSEQIEVIKGQMQYYEQASATSSISVQISAKASVQPITVAGWEPKGVARNAIQALLSFAKGFVNFLIWVGLYVLPILIFIGLPIFLFVRLLVRRNRSKRTMPPIPGEKK